MCACAAALPRSERVTALQRRAMVGEVQLHLSTLVSLGCFCMHIGGRAASGTWAPLVARAAAEALLWNGYADAGIDSALLMVADSLRGAGTTDQALHVYFCTYDYWETWAELEAVRSLHALHRSAYHENSQLVSLRASCRSRMVN